MSRSQSKSSRAEDVRRRIKKRSCSTFIAITQQDHCQCGRSRQQHPGEESNRDSSGCMAAAPGDGAVWDPERHTVTEQSKDYGLISFRGYGCTPRYGQFSRIDHRTDADITWSLLTSTQLWDLPLPEVFLSIIGGGAAPGVTPLLEAKIKRLFGVASVVTDAWLVTDGRRGWLNGLVGQGIQEEVERQQRSDYGPVVLGVASWGNVANTKALEKAGLNVLDLYKTGNSPQRQEHFLFALLKPVADLESQLSLALACNFLPLARCCLQAGGYGTKESQDPRHTPMLSALIHNQVDFVQLFLESNLDLCEFLTTNTLRVLFDPEVRENVRVIARYQWARTALFHYNLAAAFSPTVPPYKEELGEFEGEALERYLTRSQDTLNN